MKSFFNSISIKSYNWTNRDPGSWNLAISIPVSSWFLWSMVQCFGFGSTSIDNNLPCSELVICDCDYSFLGVNVSNSNCFNYCFIKFHKVYVLSFICVRVSWNKILMTLVSSKSQYYKMALDNKVVRSVRILQLLWIL